VAIAPGALAIPLPQLPLFSIIDGYKDIQSVVAVLEAQQSFATDHNTAHYKGDGPLDIPDEQERIRYLGYLLTRDIDLERRLKVQLQFNSRYAGVPLILMLRAFGLQGKHKIRLTQGLSIHQDATVNVAGNISFEFEPIGDWLKHPDRVTGFLVYLIRPPGPKHTPGPALVESAEADEAGETGIVRASPGLNVYRHIDMRV
ncbi:MAG: hypothetical protein CVV27_11545, partial [Candidatus Melainabacteria bacterium HGW-Melainabacteria-1]